jgi:hypothetical protein
MKWSLISFLLLFFCIAVNAKEPNLLISIHKVELNNKNKPIKRTYSKKYSEYQLINENTRKIKSFKQNRKARAIYLDPGRYCFKSFNISSSQRVNILNPLCFIVSENVLSNAGTWVVGARVSNDGWYALLVEMKDNYSELESILKVEGSVPAVFYKPEGK